MKNDKRLILGILFGLILIGIFSYLLFSNEEETFFETDSPVNEVKFLDLATKSFQNVLVGYSYTISLEGEDEDRYIYIAYDGERILARCEIDKYTYEYYIYNYTASSSGGNEN